jgi:hypothetical protein
MNPLDDLAPDYSRGFLRVPLSVWQALYCRAPLTRRQLQLVSVVLRESWGWQTKGGTVYRWTRPLTPRQFAQATGLSTDHLRRDLQILVARGVLRELAGRYQLVPDPQLWKTPLRSPQKGRPRALKLPAASAETALLPPDLKTAKIRQRNVARFPEDELSPTGDNSRIADRSVSEDRFVAVLAAFTGELSAEQRKCLGAWIRQEGTPTVWAALAEPFRRGPAAVRRSLEAQLKERSGPET